MSAVFEEMIRKGNVVAKLRMAELTHLEALLDAQRRQVSMASLQSFPVPRYTSDSASTSQLLSTPNLDHEAQYDNHSNSFEVGWTDSDGFLDPFETGSEDILALAEQLEHDDFSFSF